MFMNINHPTRKWAKWVSKPMNGASKQSQWAGKVKYLPVSMSGFYLMIGSNLTLKHFWASLAVCLVALNLWYFSKANWTSDAGHNIVADGWAEASNPYLKLNPHPTHKQGSHMVSGSRCPAWSDQPKKWSESMAACPIRHRGEFPDVPSKHI